MLNDSLFFATEIAGGITRRGVFWRGVFLLATGVLIALKPLLATFTLSAMFGGMLTVGGVWIAAGAFRRTSSRWRRWAWGIYGTVLFVIGILLLANPAAELTAFAWSVSLMLLSGGVIGISVSLAADTSCLRNLFCFFTSVCSILLGALLFLGPVTGLTELIWVLGVLLAVEGIVLIGVAFGIPSADKEKPAR
ncbi:MAG: DUF308 domain-containing protein [Lentisphaeria bacterium]|nr:DUF308 domain-containing protein [Lentisphaeria bacterium]